MHQPRDVNDWIGRCVNFLRRTGSLNMIYVTLHQLQRIAPVTQTFAIWLSSGWRRVVRNKKCRLHVVPNLEISLKILLSEPDLDTLRVFDSNQLWKLHFQFRAKFYKINLTVLENVGAKRKKSDQVTCDKQKDSFLGQKVQF